ncbi:MAG: cytochrome b/b6 domain-containing protein [Bacteroidales bacterium]|nr:cytochrome b/b6 domain-containing protein [Bacteroidales bacterium]
MSTKIYLYPVWVRIWHGINALMFIFLILTGLSMQYSNPEYPLIRFDLAVTYHNIVGIVVVFAYVFYFFANKFTPNGKYYSIKRKGWIGRIKRQLYYYTIGIFKKEQPPFPISETQKFNPLQKFSYVIVMYVLLPLVIITGLALLFPEVIITTVFGLSGIYLTVMLHIISGFLLSIFLIVHVYFCTIGATTFCNFKSMVTGWHMTH